MAKAVILENLEKGRYRVEIKRELGKIKNLQSAIENRLIEINTELPQLLTEKADKKIEWDTTVDELEAQIDLLKECLLLEATPCDDEKDNKDDAQIVFDNALANCESCQSSYPGNNGRCNNFSDDAEPVAGACEAKKAAVWAASLALKAADKALDECVAANPRDSACIEFHDPLIKVIQDKIPPLRNEHLKLDADYKTLLAEKSIILKEWNFLDDLINKSEKVTCWSTRYEPNWDPDDEVLAMDIRQGKITRTVLFEPHDDIDGCENYSIRMEPAASYFDMAIMTGMEKWRPRYRVGTITAIDYDSGECTVELAAAIITKAIEGSPIDLNINDMDGKIGNILVDIPIEYPHCNQYVFEIGDLIVVKFENREWKSGKVIGFVTDPVECISKLGFHLTPNTGCEDESAESCWYGWGSPFESGEPPAPINPPWGTAGSETQNASILFRDNNKWKHWRDPETDAWDIETGVIDWQGNGEMVSWGTNANATRYGVTGGSKSFYRGKMLSSSVCSGACVRKFDGKTIVILVQDTLGGISVSTYNGETGLIEWTTNLTISNPPGIPHYYNYGTYWLFNASGTRAVQVKEYRTPSPYHNDCHKSSLTWRKKFYLDVDLRVGAIYPHPAIADITFIEVGDEMPIVDPPVENFSYVSATEGIVASRKNCKYITTNPCDSYLTDETLINRTSKYTEHRDGSSGGSYKVYDFQGDTEVSAEFYYTRSWEYDYETGIAAVVLKDVPCCEKTAQELDPEFTFPGPVTYNAYPSLISGSGTVTCGVKFTGLSGMTDMEWVANDTLEGAGERYAQSFPAGIPGSSYSSSGDGSVHDEEVTTTSTRLRLAIPWLDMRYSQIIHVVEKREVVWRDRQWFSYPANNYDQEGTDTVTLITTIDTPAHYKEIIRNSSIAVAPDEPPVHKFKNYHQLAQNPHRTCRGYGDGGSGSFDYLFNGTIACPRPMAYVEESHCISYVDRWRMHGESDAENTDIPPIRSVVNYHISGFIVGDTIPGVNGNAAPILPVEPNSDSESE